MNKMLMVHDFVAFSLGLALSDIRILVVHSSTCSCTVTGCVVYCFRLSQLFLFVCACFLFKLLIGDGSLCEKYIFTVHCRDWQFAGSFV